MSFPRRLARLPTDHPWLALLFLVAVGVATLYPPPEIRYAAEDVTDLDPDDPEIRYLASFNERFGDDEILLVALESEDAFAPEAIAHLFAVTRAAARLPGIESVVSLATVDDFVDEDGEMRSEPFFPSATADPSVLEAKKRRALANELWTGLLLSRDSTITTVSAVLRKENGGVPHRAATAAKLREIGEQGAPEGMTIHVAGRGAMILDAEASARGDLFRYAWVTPLWIALVLGYAFRSVRGILLPLLVCGTAVALVVGLYLRAGNPLGMVFTMLPTQIAVICLSDVIHVIAHHRECSALGLSRRETVLRTMDLMLPTCFYTAATSAIGFLSFNAAGLETVATFGTWTGIGIGVAFVVAMLMLPASFMLLPPERAPRTTRADGTPGAHFANPVSTRLIAMALALLRLSPRGRIVLASTWAVILGVAVLGMTRLEVDTNFATYLPSDSQSARATKILGTKLAGTASLEIVLEGPEYAFEEPYGIAALETVATYLASREEVDKTFSVLDFLGRVHQQRGGEGAFPRDAALLTEAFYLLGNSDEVSRFVTADRAAARLTARLHGDSTQDSVELVDSIEALASEIDPRLELRTTGVSKLFAATSQALVEGQTKSLFTSLFWVSLAMIIAVRSLRVGLIALLPNVTPIVLTLGLMGYAGMPLDIATIMVGSIALGIAVDDTIHLIARHGAERRREPRGALERALRSAGHPAIFTSLLFAGGFATFAASEFAPIEAFGILGAFAMISAMCSDLTLLPLLLARPADREASPIDLEPVP
jgi:predicted RND superfamily exporter protein